jgi:TolB protein
MKSMRKIAAMSGVLLALLQPATGQRATQSGEQVYNIAFASFAPLNTDIFVADTDGNNAEPLIAHPEPDYNPSFSPDGGWVVFTSTRHGSADLFRVRPSGEGLERLTDDGAFDDQGVISPDGRYLAFTKALPSDLGIPRLARSRRGTTGGESYVPRWRRRNSIILFSSSSR